MRTCLITRVFAVAVFAVFSLAGLESVNAQEKKEEDGLIQIYVQGGKDCPFVAVTVLRDGKAMASRDISPDLQSGSGYVIERLPRNGSYEVHFQAPHHTTLIRKIFLEHEKRASLNPTMVKGTGTIVLGSGPSLQELEARIRQLEDVVAKLKK